MRNAALLAPVLASLVLASLAADAQAATAKARHPRPVAAKPAGGAADPARLSAIVKTLASDDFQGRAPGSPGEAKTIEYLTAQFKALGLEPAGDRGGYTQTVPLLHTQIAQPGAYGIVVGNAALPLAFGKEISPLTLLPTDHVAIKDAPLVFVGYGVSAPERGWDDYKGVDLKGKVVVVLINDPDFEAKPGEPVAGKFGGQAEAYYGRWTYKYDEAARRGAAAVLIVHETPGAGYGWSTVMANNGEGFDIVRADPARERLQLQGWITRDIAVELFRRAGLDFEAQKTAARSAEFKPVTLKDATFSADYQVSHEVVQSHNVVGKLSGKGHPKESVMFSAHWDAYGVGAPDAHGDTIRRGAADDAIGVAGVMELARAFKARPRTDRSLYFAAWTGEERGLLGSEFYGVNPTTSLPKMAANFTMDVLQTAGPSRDVVLVGYGQSQLDDRLAAAAKRQGRTVTPDAHPEKGLFFRADHFSRAKHGVPVMLLMGLGGGPDLLAGGRAAGDRWVNDYTVNCYHKACDAWSADWDLRGAAADVDLLYAMGRDLASSRAWPDWKPGSEFRAIRAETTGQRK
jgi:Zn-dependent M28 family amino/carboxypeptidase